MRFSFGVFFLMGFAAITTRLAADEQMLERAGDAYVLEDTDSQEWTIGSRAIRLTMNADRRRGPRVA